MTANGSYVTRAELDAHLSAIKDDVAEIKGDVKAIREQSWLGPRGRGVVNTLINGGLLLMVTTALTIAIGRFF